MKDQLSEAEEHCDCGMVNRGRWPELRTGREEKGRDNTGDSGTRKKQLEKFEVKPQNDLICLGFAIFNLADRWRTHRKRGRSRKANGRLLKFSRHERWWPGVKDGQWEQGEGDKKKEPKGWTG